MVLQGDDEEGSQSQEVPLVEQFTGVGIKVVSFKLSYRESLALDLENISVQLLCRNCFCHILNFCFRNDIHDVLVFLQTLTLLMTTRNSVGNNYACSCHGALEEHINIDHLVTWTLTF